MIQNFHTTDNRFITGRILLFIFVYICYLYYDYFGRDLSIYFDKFGLFQYTLNAHDHKIYLLNIDNVRNEGLLLNIGNDRGISQIYMFFTWLFPFFIDPDLSFIALVVNSITLMGCYWLYTKICGELHLGNAAKLTFFINLSLIYFSQLINKDMFTIFVFLLACYLSIRGLLFYIVLILPIIFLVRIQLAAFVLILLYITFSKNKSFSIIISYISTSFLAGYVSVINPIIGDESLGEGFSYFLIDFNNKYYIGYLLFNPIRILQYIADAYSSFYIITENGGIDTAKLLRIPQLIIILILLRPLSTLITKYSYWMRTPARYLIFVIISYFLAWLMNPTVNARYVMLITPVIVLFALYARKHAPRTAT